MLVKSCSGTRGAGAALGSAAVWALKFEHFSSSTPVSTCVVSTDSPACNSSSTCFSEGVSSLDTASQGSKGVGTGIWVWTLQCAAGMQGPARCFQNFTGVNCTRLCCKRLRDQELEPWLECFQATSQLALRTDEDWLIFTFCSVFCSCSVFIFYFCILIRCLVFSLIFMAYIFSMFLWQPDS